MTKKRGRKPDTRIIYTPEQTRRYKSQMSRYEKGLKLAHSNLVHKIDDKTYRMESARSPVGYWEVRVAAVSALHVSGISSYSGIGSFYQTMLTINSVPGQNYIDQGDFSGASNVSAYEKKQAELNNNASIILYSEEYSGTVDLERSSDNSNIKGMFNFSRNRGDDDEHITHEDTVFGHFITNLFYFKSGVTKATISIDFRVTSNRAIYYEIDPIYYDTSIDSAFHLTAPFNLNQTNTFVIENPQQGASFIDLDISVPLPGSFTGGVNLLFETRLISIVLEGEGEGEGEGEYKCTCPDFSLTEGAFTPPDYPSTSQARDWQDTQAGCPTWADGKRRCCHIVAVQDVRGDDIPVPQDIPTGEA